MPGSDNRVQYNNALAIEPSDSQEYFLAQRRASGTATSIYNVDGSPEGVAVANPGSIAYDRTNGDIYRKATGSGNTGWVLNNDLSISRIIVDITGSSGSNFTSIQAAVNFAASQSTVGRSIIYIRPGAYNEAVTIPSLNPSPINLVGATGENPELKTVTTTSIDFAAGFAVVDNVEFLCLNGGSNTIINNCVLGFNSTCTSNVFLYNSKISRITFTLDATNDTFVNNCEFTNTVTLTNSSNLPRIQFKNCQFNLTVTFSAGTIKTDFIGCYFRNSSAGGSVAGTNLGDTIFSNCVFGGNTASGNLTHQAITLTGNVFLSEVGTRSVINLLSTSPTPNLLPNLQGNIAQARRVATSVNANLTDYYIGVTDTSAARTISLPNTSVRNQIYIIKDESGAAGTNNITVTTVGGVVLLNGATSLTISEDYGSLAVIFDGTNYFTVTDSATPDSDLYAARLIVDGTNPAGANFSTIQAAINAASNGDLIAIRPGTYTENLVIEKDLSFTSLEAVNRSSSARVIIVGNHIDNGTEINCRFTGIGFRTNGDYAFELTGAGSDLTFINCSCNAFDFTFLSLSETNQNAFFYSSQINTGTTGVSWFDMTAGTVWSYDCTIANDGASTTSGTFSAGALFMFNSRCFMPFTTTGSAYVQIVNSVFGVLVAPFINQTWLTIGGSEPSEVIGSSFYSGTASAISVGSSANIVRCTVNSSNTNAITGAGTTTIDAVTFTGSSIQNNATTQSYSQFGAYGTWTPTLTGGTSAGTTTYVRQVGQFHRIGNLVWIQGIIEISGATGTGAATIGGLPFTVKNVTSGNPTGSISQSATGWAFPAGRTSLNIRGNLNSTQAEIIASGSSVASASMQMTNSAGTWNFTMVYEV